MTCDVADIAYYEFYDYYESEKVPFTSASGNDYECSYFVFSPKGAELTEDTPVIAYVTHGGGVADEERAIALNHAASFGTEAIFVVPWTDRPEGVCACIEAAKAALDVGDFDNISIHGTSSGARAIIRAAQESVDPEENYSFRFANIIAYDPINETTSTNITGNTEALKALAEKGTVLFIQTDTDHSGHSNGTGAFCNYIAQVYSQYGGTAIIAEIHSGSHEKKFIKPISHNSISWGAGIGELLEDEHYSNDWYYYLDGAKTLCDLEKADELLDEAREPGDKAPSPSPTPPAVKVGRTVMK